MYTYYFLYRNYTHLYYIVLYNQSGISTLDYRCDKVYTRDCI